MPLPFSRHAGEYRFALVLFARDANRAGVSIPPDIARLIHELTDAISEVGNAEVERETIDGVRTHGTPDEAGRAVGLTGRQVRNLCSSGKVGHRVVGAGRYLVDVEDLQRHLRDSA